MKYVDEYREGDAARRIAAEIRHEADPKRIYRFMEFCGGHTHVLARWGLTDILPPNVRMIHGPGCPVCVLPVARIDMAMQLALERNVILCTYADTMRFETTTPPTAVVLKAAKAAGVKNFSVFCNHVLTPAAMTHILKMSEERPEVPVLDGLVGPAHVSTIIGSGPYEVFARDNRLPVVVTGFEPLDMLYAILMMVRQVNDGRHEVENEFTRAVTRDGNVAAIRLMDEVFELRDSFEWRGLGRLPKSALKLRPEWADFDAEKRFAMTERAVTDNKACACGAILRGEKTPEQCPLFGRACNPANPIGACMVSSEGACAAAWSYGRRRAAGPEQAKTSDDQR